uniref:Nephronophthisis 1 n=1 Tax=Cynoglossus semilaevis TaxID=244447 RepID=A0A3P8UE34_CYNSE
MPPRRKGAFQLAKKEVDETEKQVMVQSLIIQTDYFIKKSVFSICSQADELAPVGNYEQRKQEEEKRLQNILDRLNTLSLELSPPGPSTDASNISTEDSGDEDDEDSVEDEDEDKDDEVDEKLAVKPPSQSDPRIYKVLSDFQGEQDGDLSVQKGDLLRIVRRAADGWWLAQDSKGKRGVVPKTYLKIIFMLIVIGDESKNNHVYLYFNSKTPQSNWSTLRKALTEIDATDVLSAMGAIPSGFRPSTLNKLLVEEGVMYRGSHHVQPSLSQSQLSFKDLFLDVETGRVRARHVQTCLCFTLWSCRMIPTPGVGVQVLSRHVRLCAFDGNQVLSNIHTVRATYNPKSPKTWSFSPRMTGVLPSLLDGDCFLRCSSSSPDLGILFELGVTFIRNSTGERGELSCGWSFLKLTDDSGNSLPSRTYELQVNGGTPYEKNVELETSVRRGCKKKQVQSKSETIKYHLHLLSSISSSPLHLLPETLLHCLNCVHLLALHRQLLADTLLMDRPTMQNAELISSPFLSTFPVLLDQPDLLDALRGAWLEAEIRMRRTEDLSFLKQEFVKVYMSSVYFLLHSPSLPPYRWADPASEEQRAKVIYITLDSLKHVQQTTGISGSPEVFFDHTHQHLAFDLTELNFDLLGVAQ